ncbi:MAG TPA: hypothetical protein VL485_12865 [Ktedonobacteraceae bacterium]|jgi:hypothetical protein|nr:hypothetical protein [Ktedonobacteraceae bacterium]
MSTPSAKKTRLPVWAQVILTIFVVGIVLVLVLLFGPREGDTDNVTGDYAETPTVSVTNSIETAMLKQQMDFQGVHITLNSATLAEKFSDDRKRAGTYTLRVLANTENTGKEVVGINYTSVVSLVLPSGQTVAAKLVSIKPTQLPGVVQTGFFDFPVSSKIPLAQLHIRFGTTDIPLAGQ